MFRHLLVHFVQLAIDQKKNQKFKAFALRNKCVLCIMASVVHEISKFITSFFPSINFGTALDSKTQGTPQPPVISKLRPLQCNTAFSDIFLLYTLYQTDNDKSSPINIRDDHVFEKLFKKEKRFISKNIVCLCIV